MSWIGNVDRRFYKNLRLDTADYKDKKMVYNIEWECGRPPQQFGKFLLSLAKILSIIVFLRQIFFFQKIIKLHLFKSSIKFKHYSKNSKFNTSLNKLNNLFYIQCVLHFLKKFDVVEISSIML